MPFQLVVIRGRSSINHHRLGPGVTVAGRQEGCQLQIKSSQVSRKHCELFEKDGRLIVKDLNSSNGTFVNGERIDGQHALATGDELSIGGVKFRVEPLTAAAAAAADTSISPVEPALALDDAIPVDEGDTIAAAPAAPEPAARAVVEAEPETVAEAASEAEAEAVAEEATEIGEDAVAEFLMDLDVDEDDKR